MAHSQAAYDAGIKVDFQGVLILMWSTTVPLIHYTFPDHPVLEATYHLGTAVLALLVSVATFHPAMGAVHLGHLRARLFACFGVGSFIAPILHGALLDGLELQRKRVGLEWVLMTALCNATGMMAYSCKVCRFWKSQWDGLG
jgi:adiponectin receptor